MTTKSKYFFVSKSKSNTNLKMYTPAPKVNEHTIVTQCVFCLVCNNFFHIFLSKNYSQKFYTLFVWACHLRGFIFVKSCVSFPLNDYLVYFLPKLSNKSSSKISHNQQQFIAGGSNLNTFLLSTALWRDRFLTKFDINFLLNVDFAFFLYSHKSGSITFRYRYHIYIVLL